MSCPAASGSRPQIVCQYRPVALFVMRLLAVERAISVKRSADDAGAVRAATLSCVCTVHGPTECGTVHHYFQPAFILPVAMRVPTNATEVVLT